MHTINLFICHNSQGSYSEVSLNINCSILAVLLKLATNTYGESLKVIIYHNFLPEKHNNFQKNFGTYKHQEEGMSAQIYAFRYELSIYINVITI